jgi:hypothetical protein
VPRYRIEQYELHAQTYEVEADSPGKAIEKLFDGCGDAVDNGLEYVEVADKYGMGGEEFDEKTFDSLREYGLLISDSDYLTSIRSIEELP